MAILTTCMSTFVDLNEINIGDVAPSSPSNNELWFSTTDNVVYKWDETLKQWIVVNDYTEEIRDAIAGIEINSRNLLYDTATAIDIITNNTEIKTIKLHELVNSLDYIKHLKGNTITFAFDWEYIGTTPMGSFYIQTDGPQYTKLSNQIAVSSTNYYGTEKLTVNLASDSTFNSTSIVCTHNNGTIRIMHCRLLFGDKDLGWTQAPEDLVSKFETIFNRTAKGIYMQASGNGKTSLVNVENQEIKIKSNNINIEGYTTINEHFKILPSGDLEAVNAKFSGTVDAFNISGATIKGSVLTTGTNFSVDSAGLLTAKNGNFSGSISASDITGSTFTSTNNKFKVLADGTIEATNGNFTGNINTGSTITGSDIVGSTIRNANSTFTVSSDGIITGASVKGGTIGIGNGTSYNAFTVDVNGNVSIAKGSINLGSGAFTVSNTGALSATSASITGNINSGSTITGSTITGSTISTTSGKFSVNSDGVLTASEAVITGKITIGTGSTVGASYLTGVIDNERLNSAITTGATNGTAAQTTLNSKASGWDGTKSTVDSNSANWINAYNRVVQWAYGAVSDTTTIDGGLIQTNTILADKIAIADFSNYVTLKPNVDSAGGPNGGTWSCYNVTSSSLNHTPFTNKINNVKEGDKFRVTGWIWCATAAQGVVFNVGMRRSDGTYISGTDAIYKVSKASTYEQFSLELTVPAIPTGFSFMTIKSYLTNETCPVWLYGVGIYRMSNGELIVDGAIDGKTITGATLRGGTIGIGGTAYDAFTVDTNGNVAIKKGSIDINNGAFSVNSSGALTATSAVITGTITAGTGSSIGASYLTGIIDNGRLNSSITTGATNGTAAQSTLNSKASGWDSTKSTVDSNSSKWMNAYDRVLQWAYGAVTGSTTINGGLIQTNTILANKIAIGDFNNYCELTPTNCTSFGFTKVADASASNNPWLQLNILTRDIPLCSSKNYEAYTGNVTGSYRIEYEFSSNVTGMANTNDENVSYLNVNVGLYCKTNTGVSSWYIPTGVKSSSAATPTTVSTTIKIPSNIVSFGVYLQLDGWSSFAGTCKVRNIRVTKMMTGELIVDGAIDGQTITGATLRGGTIGIGNGTAYDAFTVDTIGNVTIKKGSIDINNGAFSVSDTGVLTATSANITGNINSGSTIIGATIKNATNTFSVSPNGVITGASIKASEISTTSGNFSVNNSGILYAKGAIITGNVTITGGSVPDSVLSSTVTSGATNGSSALNGLNNLSIGGRNLARSTSSTFSSPYSSFSGTTNVCPPLAYVYTDGLSVGDTVTVQLIYSYTDVVAATGQTASFWIQGSGNATAWSSGAFNGSPSKTLSGSGEQTVTYTFTITANHLLNDYWSTNIRHDYIQSGTVQWRSFKVEKGNKPTDWSPAPEDLIDSIAETEKALNDNIDNAVGNVKTDVLQSVEEKYTPIYEFNALSQSMSSKFAQTAKDISATFTTVNNYTKDVDGKLQDFQDTVESYIKFSANGIDLGKTNSPFTATLDNKQLAFKQDNEVVAYINNNKMVITTADIDNELRIGDSTNGFFVWTQGENGNLTLKWSDK